MAGPFSYPSAEGIPFEPNRNGSEIASENVQSAIEEAKLDAINNDRFIVLASYGGNAASGRYLEFFPGIDSSEAQIFLAAASKILNVTAQTTAGASNCTIGFFDINVSSSVPLYTITFSAQKRVIITGSPLVPLAVTAPNAQIAIRVTNGNIAKPHVLFTLSAAT